jgi:2-haloacid dehalogenase
VTTPAAPSTLVFDVNETLLDIESLGPQFEHIFGDRAALRTWFAELVLYSMTLTLSNCYVDFFRLGSAVLSMLGDIRGVHITHRQQEDLREAMRSMPAHPDVMPSLTRLSDSGFRLVTLTNSPHVADAPTALRNAGLADYFERQFTVDAVAVFKPAAVLYRGVAADLDVAESDCMMVAAHAWDTIGAQSVGMQGALITRPGNAALVAEGVPQPTLIARDLTELAAQLIE